MAQVLGRNKLSIVAIPVSKWVFLMMMPDTSLCSLQHVSQMWWHPKRKSAILSFTPFFSRFDTKKWCFDFLVCEKHQAIWQKCNSAYSRKYIFRPAVLFSLKSICLEGRRSNKILILDLMCQIAWRKKEWIELKNTTFPSFESVSSECVSELWQWLVAKTFRVKCLEVPEGLFHRLHRVPDRYKQ